MEGQPGAKPGGVGYCHDRVEMVTYAQLIASFTGWRLANGGLIGQFQMIVKAG